MNNIISYNQKVMRKLGTVVLVSLWCFHFFNVSDGDLKKIFPSSKSNKMRLKNTTATIETKQKNIHCPVCYKKNVKHGLNCSSCNLLIHKKCSKLSQREILDLKKQVNLGGNVQLA